jgi:hypothetical protein
MWQLAELTQGWFAIAVMVVAVNWDSKRGNTDGF